jgi:hypothetical protein
LASHLTQNKIIENQVNIQDGDLRFPISQSDEPCIFAIIKPKNFKFWILIENYITTNNTSGISD